MSRAPSLTVIKSRLELALEAAVTSGLTVYGYRIGDSGEVHVITSAATHERTNEAEKWFAEN